jgi:hypothetical protein
MAWSIAAGIWISPDNNTWYKLTDDNRGPIQSAPVRIEQVQRMANGTMRKFVVANKNVIDCSWSYVPAASSTLYTGNNTGAFAPTTDGNYGAAFMKAFYNKYVFQPIYIRLVMSTDNTNATAFKSSQFGTKINPIQISSVLPNYSLATLTPGSVTFTTSTAHGLVVGQIVDVAGVFPVEYNRSYVVNAVNANSFAVSSILTATASGTYKTVTPRSGTELYQVFMTDFKYTTVKRFTLTDYVDFSIQFTEI